MYEILKLAAKRKACLDAHPFYVWLRESSTPIEQRFRFAPILANFVMSFRDMNLWFIRFDQNVDELKEIINGNTREDETHSALFLEDWRKLGLDQHLGWKAGDTLWWLFLAKETEPFRSYAVDFAQMTIADGDDPCLRFAHSESGEHCGNSFFEVSAPVAHEYRLKTGDELRYFGHHHLNRERGHVIASEGVFDLQELDPPRRKKGLELANGMFDIFFGMHDNFLAYAINYVDRGRTPQRTRFRMPLPAPERSGPEPQRKSRELSPSHAEVQRVLDERRRLTAKHPFYAWLRRRGELAPADTLRRFIPMWVMDIMGYRDLNRYALRFRKPASPEEMAYNRWADALESHSSLFMNDWDALRLDELLGWDSGDTLGFLFLDPGTDVHRRNISSFIKLALRHPQPNLRFWLLEALEASGEAFFHNTSVVAKLAENELDARLDYLADRHWLAHPPGSFSSSAEAYPFKSGELGPEERDIAIGMVDTVFDAVDEQLHLSLTVAETDRLGIGKRTSARRNERFGAHA